MTKLSLEELLKLFHEFDKLFNGLDIGLLENCFTEDAVYSAATGEDEFGTLYVGRKEIVSYLVGRREHTPDLAFETLNVSLLDGRAVTEFRVTGTSSGQRFARRGIDMITLEGTKLKAKHTYWKAAAI